MRLCLKLLRNTIKGFALGIEEESDIKLRERMHFILAINC